MKQLNKKCPICNGLYTENDVYCLKCNYRLKYLSDYEKSKLKEDKNYEAKIYNKQRQYLKQNNPINISTDKTISFSPQIITCPACQGKVSNQAKSCPHCGQPINTQITCPKCGSQDIENIGGFKKGVSALAFGVFSANTVLNNYKCKNCRLKFK